MSAPERSQFEPQYKYKISAISEVLFDFGESFDVSSYRNNPHRIKDLYDDCVRAYAVIKKTAKLLDDQNELIASIPVLKSELAHEREKNNLGILVQAVLVILGTTLLAFGVNLATSSPSNQAGWVMSIFGVLLQFAAIAVIFLLKLMGRRSDG